MPCQLILACRMKAAGGTFPFPPKVFGHKWPCVGIWVVKGSEGNRLFFMFENAPRKRIEEAIANCNPPLWKYFSTAWFSKQAPLYRGKPPEPKNTSKRNPFSQGHFFYKGKPLSNNNHKGFTKIFLDTGLPFTKEGLQQQQRLIAKIPRQKALSLQRKALSANKGISLGTGSFLQRKAFSNNKGFLQRFLDKRLPFCKGKPSAAATATTKALK